MILIMTSDKYFFCLSWYCGKLEVSNGKLQSFFVSEINIKFTERFTCTLGRKEDCSLSLFQIFKKHTMILQFNLPNLLFTTLMIHYFAFCCTSWVTGPANNFPFQSALQSLVCVVVSAASFPPSPRSSASSDNVLQRSPIPNPVNNNCSPRNIINIVLSSPTQQPNRNTLILIIYFILLITTPIPTTIAF